MTTWLHDCRSFAAEHGIEDAVSALQCFAGPEPRGGPPAPMEIAGVGSFEALERAVLGELAIPSLPSVDADQAALFGRRLTAVDTLLGELSGIPEARLLRVGLRVRLVGIGRSAAPRALRARGLADFYYSLGVAARHRADGGDLLPSIATSMSGLSWRDLGGGLRVARFDGRCLEGPQHVNVLEVDPDEVKIEAVDLRAEAQDFPTAVTTLGARAATSGGFFLYSEPDIAAPSARFDPVGLVVGAGRVLGPPVFRRGALLVGEGTAIRRLGPEGCELQISGTRARVEQAWNRADGEVGGAVPSVAIVASRVVDVGTSLAVPLNGVVVAWAGSAAVGAEVEWALPSPIRTAMAGGPMLRIAGEPSLDYRAEDFYGTAPPRTFSQDETNDRNLLPRMAVGRRSDGVLLFAAVDGRHAGRALGLTLRTTGELLGALGCTDVLNLDGGSSKRMVVDGVAVDLASTEVRTGAGGPTRGRPVHTALLFQ